jgi:hypothetical protein
MLIQKILIAFRFLSLPKCDWLCAWPCGLLGTLLRCFVIRSAPSIALLAGWYEVVKAVAATSVNLNEMICFGGLPTSAPMAGGFVGQDDGPVFVVLGRLSRASVL